MSRMLLEGGADPVQKKTRDLLCVQTSCEFLSLCGDSWEIAGLLRTPPTRRASRRCTSASATAFLLRFRCLSGGERHCLSVYFCCLSCRRHCLSVPPPFWWKETLPFRCASADVPALLPLRCCHEGYGKLAALLRAHSEPSGCTAFRSHSNSNAPTPPGSGALQVRRAGRAAAGARRRPAGRPALAGEGGHRLCPCGLSGRGTVFASPSQLRHRLCPLLSHCRHFLRVLQARARLVLCFPPPLAG